VRLVLAALPELPAAPSLPRRSPNEGMLAQAAWGVPGVTIGPDGTLFVDLDRLDPTAPVGDLDLGGDAFVTLRAFLAAVTDRQDPIKLQLTGPITLGLALHNAGAPAELAFTAAASAVDQRVASLRPLVAAPAVLLLDEPGLTGAPHPGFPITLSRAVDVLGRALAGVRDWAVAGVHCCGRADWDAVIAAGPEVLSLTIDAAAEMRPGLLQRHLDDGGWVAWGAVPTDGPIPDAARLYRMLAQRWHDAAAAGCDMDQIAAQSLVTPACGLANHGERQAEQVLRLAAEIAAGLRHRVAHQ
jgi:methionine synthase II (cobalamin-independent)